MKFVVIGAGAVGGYFGAKLQAGGEDVRFLVREGRHAELEQNGLRVLATEGMIELKAHAVRRVEEIENCDIVIVAVKNYNLDEVLQSVSYLTNHGANVLTLMNGVEQFGKIRTLVSDKQIVGGVCHLESTFDHGLILQTGITPLVILGSPSPEGMASASEVASAFRRAKIKTVLSERIIADVWKKFIFITALSTVTSMTRSPIGPIITNDYSRKVLNRVVDEIASVAIALVPELPQTVSKELLEQIERLPQSMTSSMERDLERGRPLEVENLQGYLVRKAQQLGVPVPTVTVCYNILKLREHGQVDTR
ncbi:MAG: ketopantoate reductase family protein [Nitrososphaerales archaeon]